MAAPMSSTRTTAASRLAKANHKLVHRHETDRPKAVVFDVGDVLYRWDPRFLYEKLIPDTQHLEWFLTHVVTREWHFQHDAGRPVAETTAELAAAFPAERDLIEIYDARWLETIPGPVLGSLELATALHQSGVPLYGITNFSAEFWPRFRATKPIFDLFQDIVVSGVEKIVKPDPRIYALARERFGLGDGEALFIDDNLANVEAAREAGWHAHHFQGADGLHAELLRRGFSLVAEPHHGLVPAATL